MSPIITSTPTGFVAVIKELALISISAFTSFECPNSLAVPSKNHTSPSFNIIGSSVSGSGIIITSPGFPFFLGIVILTSVPSSAASIKSPTYLNASILTGTLISSPKPM